MYLWEVCRFSIKDVSSSVVESDAGTHKHSHEEPAPWMHGLWGSDSRDRAFTLTRRQHSISAIRIFRTAQLTH